MERFISCIAHKSSEGKLLIGSQYTALFDCGMIFCASKTIGNIETALGGRDLDYLFLSHTHYDHLGAMPFLRKRWKNLRVLTTETGAAVLKKDTPRRVYRELSHSAAITFAEPMPDEQYDDDAYYADIIIKDGDVTDLGGVSVKAIETPGHTRDCVSYFIPELSLLILSETTGVILPDGTLLPCFITSVCDTIDSINKCRNAGCKYISLPHSGLLKDKEADSFFDRSIYENEAYRDFILALHKKGSDENAIVKSLFDKYYSDILLSMQPKEGFMQNAHAAVATVLRESG